MLLQAITGPANATPAVHNWLGCTLCTVGVKLALSPPPALVSPICPPETGDLLLCFHYQVCIMLHTPLLLHFWAQSLQIVQLAHTLPHSANWPPLMKSLFCVSITKCTQCWCIVYAVYMIPKLGKPVVTISVHLLALFMLCHPLEIKLARWDWGVF